MKKITALLLICVLCISTHLSFGQSACVLKKYCLSQDTVVVNGCDTFKLYKNSWMVFVSDTTMQLFYAKADGKIDTLCFAVSAEVRGDSSLVIEDTVCPIIPKFQLKYSRYKDDADKEKKCFDSLFITSLEMDNTIYFYLPSQTEPLIITGDTIICVNSCGINDTLFSGIAASVESSVPIYYAPIPIEVCEKECKAHCQPIGLIILLVILLLLALAFVVFVVVNRTSPVIDEETNQETDLNNQAGVSSTDETKQQENDGDNTNKEETEGDKQSVSIKEHNEQMAALKRRLEEQMAASKENYEKQIDELKKEHKANIESERKKKDEEFAKERERFAKERERKDKEFEEEKNKLKKKIEEKDAEIKNIEDRVRKEMQKKIDSLEDEKNKQKKTLDETRQNLTSTKKELEDTTTKLKNEEQNVAVLKAAQKQFTDKLTFTPWASEYSKKIARFFELAEKVVQSANKLMNTNVEDPYMIAKAIATYEVNIGSIDMARFSAEVFMAANKQMAFNESGIVNLATVDEKSRPKSLRHYFIDEYLRKYINAIVVLNESLAGVHHLIHDLSSSATKPFEEYRSSLNKCFNELEIKVISVKLFDKVTNNVDLKVTEIDYDTAIPADSILEITNCIVYAADANRPSEKIYVKSQK